MHFSSFAAAAALFHLSIAGYVLEDDYMTDFYGHFDFFTAEDPTNGFVKYVDEATAREMNLINASTTAPVEWGVDSTNKTPEGRPSIRLEGKKKYTGGLVMIDVQHMPFGCGTWPAFWTLGPDWPSGGEIDILEGVNEQDKNGMTLHTGPGCEIGSDHALFAGEVDTQNCDVKAEGQMDNAGCSIKHPSTKSYGAGFNENGGGVYATEWTDEAISIWFFPRGEIPEDALGDAPSPSGWGKPAAKFQGGCDISNTFKENQLIFTSTFCGDWAGGVWKSGSCASKAPTCNDYVRDNPEAFANAHWTINALKVYQNAEGGSAPEPSGQPTPAPTGEPEPTAQPDPFPTTEVLTPAPLPTGNNGSFPTVAPPQEPPIETTAPEPPAETSIAENPDSAPSSVLDLPSESRTQADQLSSTQAPSLTTDVPSNDDGPMPGFTWPQPGEGDAPAPTGTGTPVNSENATAPTPTTVQTVPTPDVPSEGTPPLTGEVPADTKVPEPDNGIDTVYETVYVTVVAPAETPAAKRRHLGQHRRRLMQRHVL